MFRKYVSLMLAILIINLACGVTAFASNSNDEKEDKIAEKLKTKITKIGTGADAKIIVKLKDGTKIKGYVTEITDDSFTVMNKKTNVPAKILYSQAKQVYSNNPQTGLVIFGIVGGIASIIALIFAGRSG